MARLTTPAIAVTALIFSTSAAYCAGVTTCAGKESSDCRLGSPDIEVSGETSNFGACELFDQHTDFAELRGRDGAATAIQSRASGNDLRGAEPALDATQGSPLNTIDARGETSSVQDPYRPGCVAAPCQSPSDESCAKYIGDMPAQAETPAPVQSLLVWAMQLFSASEPQQASEPAN